MLAETSDSMLVLVDCAMHETLLQPPSEFLLLFAAGRLGNSEAGLSVLLLVGEYDVLATGMFMVLLGDIRERR